MQRRWIVLGGGGGGGGGSSGGGGYGFRRQNDDGEVEILKDAIYIQDLPRDVTREQIQDAFSSVGPIKVIECDCIAVLTQLLVLRWMTDQVVQRSGYTRIA